MKLIVFNGSPRGQKSNTRLLLEQFLKGFGETPGNTAEEFYLNRVNHQDEFQQAFERADAVLLAFPLYTDGMPGLVKTFIESLQPYLGRVNNPAMGFIVQSGFAEAAHSRHVQRYLEKLAARLGSRYIGTAVRGGVEGIQVQPPSMTRGLFQAFYELGKSFGQTGKFEPVQLKKVAGIEKLSLLATLGIKVASLFGLINFFWDMQLKQNGAFEKRFAKPYTER